jgi:SAM-dependent methyltransferase
LSLLALALSRQPFTGFRGDRLVSRPRTAYPEYVHALGWRFLNRLYDPLLRLSMPERRFKRDLLQNAALVPGHCVLDLGCGTGTLLLMARRSCGGLRVAAGVDGDIHILSLARHKARRTRTPLSLVAGNAGALPFRDMTFDRVLTSLVLHHLTRDEKRAALREVFRVLIPAGELHIADWGPPDTSLMRLAARPVAVLDGRQRVADNLAGWLPRLCEEAGFRDVGDRARFSTVFGTLVLYRAVKPPYRDRLLDMNR